MVQFYIYILNYLPPIQLLEHFFVIQDFREDPRRFPFTLADSTAPVPTVSCMASIMISISSSLEIYMDPYHTGLTYPSSYSTHITLQI